MFASLKTSLQRSTLLNVGASSRFFAGRVFGRRSVALSSVGLAEEDPILKMKEIALDKKTVLDSRVLSSESQIVNHLHQYNASDFEDKLINFGDKTLAQSCEIVNAASKIRVQVQFDATYCRREDVGPMMNVLKDLGNSALVTQLQEASGSMSYVATEQMLQDGCVKSPYALTAQHCVDKLVHLDTLTKISHRMQNDEALRKKILAKYTQERVDALARIKCFTLKAKIGILEPLKAIKDIVYEGGKTGGLDDIAVLFTSGGSSDFLKLRVVDKKAAKPLFIKGVGIVNQLSHVYTAEPNSEELSSDEVREAYGHPDTKCLVGLSRKFLEKIKSNEEDRKRYPNLTAFKDCLWYDFDQKGFHHLLSVLNGFSGMSVCDEDDCVIGAHGGSHMINGKRVNYGSLVTQELVDSIDNHWSLVKHLYL